MDNAIANEDAIDDKESEIWSGIFAEAPKFSREARLVCHLKHNVGSNPSKLPKDIVEEEILRLELSFQN